MQAVILAAGMGKRLKELTRNNTKCMISVNGTTLIERMLDQLDKLGLSRIVLVVGYEGEKLTEYVDSLRINTPVIYVKNPVYDKTNNIYSLSLAKKYMKEEDTLLLESDLIFEEDVLNCLLQDERETLALVDKYEDWMDGTVIKTDQEDNILEFIGGKKVQFQEKELYYKTVNIYKFSRDFSVHYYIPFLEAYLEALGSNEYYEQVLKVIALLDNPVIKAKKLEGQLWYEIDDIQDLDIAESIFAGNGTDKVRKLQDRYGGYWRYPKMLDYCYLVNPFFPPQRLTAELKSSFDDLLTQYPSGMAVNSLLAAKNFGIRQEYIMAGNGAAELIKAVLDLESGKLGIIKPTFEEYPNRYGSENCVVFDASLNRFQYGEKELIQFFGDKGISMLVLVNPDNPSGNYIKKENVIHLCQWTRERSVKLLVDESFADFAEGDDNTLIHDDILQEYPNLIVIKSISKSYGVPGLRLGVLASAEEGLIKTLKKNVSIWNINSFAEYYMQIAEKYSGDYVDAICRFREAKEEFIHELKRIPGWKVYPTQANYVMCEIGNGMTAAELTERLLWKYNIFIKDLTAKMGEWGQFIRLAVRKPEENHKLCEALKAILEENGRESM